MSRDENKSLKCHPTCSDQSAKHFSKAHLRQPLKEDQNLVFKIDYLLMKVESIAECYKGALCNTLNLH